MRINNSMKTYYADERPDGYRETIRRGIWGVRQMGRGVTRGEGTRAEHIARLKDALAAADAIVIGAGAGLSAAAGYTYGGERFRYWFADFADRFGIEDMYAGGFYPFPKEEILWAWWARHIYCNRYSKDPKPVYKNLLRLVDGRNCFVITTNVDHRFQAAGFDKKRLFYTQGDYGLFQSKTPKAPATYDNEAWVMEAMAAQGFVRDASGVFVPPESGLSMEIPSDMIPRDPSGGKVTMNLRSDDSFVEDEGWRAASAAYADFLRRHERLHTLYLELGVGDNTPAIIKYPFWQMTRDNPAAVYACLNDNEAYAPRAIAAQSIIINGDAAEVLEALLA